MEQAIGAGPLAGTFDVLVIESNLQRAQSVIASLKDLGYHPQLGEHCDMQSALSHDWQVLYIGDVPEDQAVSRQLGYLGASADHVKVLVAADSPWTSRIEHAPFASRISVVQYPLQPTQVREALSGDGNGVTRLVGHAPALRAIIHDIRKAAPGDSNVLVLGESGTGKEMVARTFHDLSRRKDGPFVALNCGAIPAELLESELFGHEKGSFTGAHSARPGRFEQAEGGTLFLDEIGDMSLSMQVKLLRVLQEKSFERVGGNKTRHADVRIIAATHRHIEKMVDEGSFRADLYYRLCVMEISMPSLKERASDIPELIAEFNKRLVRRGFNAVRFNPTALRALLAYSWPGNVRELQNVVERMANLHALREIQLSDLPEKIRHFRGAGDAYVNERVSLLSGPTRPIFDTSAPAQNEVMTVLPDDGIDLKTYLENVESSLIRQALGATNGVVAHAAKLLKIQRTTLAEKIRKYGDICLEPHARDA